TVTIQYYIEGGTYPKGLKVMQTLRITDTTFELYTVHTHAGTEPAPLIYVEHFYWDAPNGVEALKVNELELQELYIPQTGLVVALNTTNTIEISGKPVIVLEQENMPIGMIWHGEGDTNYICVEPISMNPEKDEAGNPYFGSKASLLQPGETKTAFVSISLK
ncbi:MAG: hypothetical protein ABIO02_03455, partial [Patescibacteria group bacterium]